MARQTKHPSSLAQHAALVGVALACLATSRPPPENPPKSPASTESAQDPYALGCASASILGDHIFGRTGEVIVAVKNESGRDGCVMYVGAMETIRNAEQQRWFQAHARTQVVVDAGATRNVSVPLTFPEGEEATCTSPRKISIWFNEGEKGTPRPVYRDANGKTRGSLDMIPSQCVDSMPVAD